MRFLEGLGQHRQVLRAPVLALEGDLFAGPGRLDELDALGDPFPAFGARNVGRDAQRPTGGRPPAPAQAQVQPAAGQDVAGGGLRGHVQRMMERRLRREGAEADALGPLCSRNRHHERVRHGPRWIEDRLGQPRAPESELLAERDLLYRLPVPAVYRRALVTGRLPEEAKAHIPCSSRG